MRPSTSEYASFYETYVSLVTEDDVVSALNRQTEGFQAACGSLSEEQSRFRYAEGKWSVREVIGHLIDCERVFGYRALGIARGETFSFPGFDENQYAAEAGHDRVPLPELIDELSHLRQSHVHMFRHFGPAVWTRIGRANENPVSVRALAFIMAGHVRHHARILSERYGIQVRA